VPECRFFLANKRRGQDKIRDIQQLREAAMYSDTSGTDRSSDPDGDGISPKEFANAIRANLIGRASKRAGGG